MNIFGIKTLEVFDAKLVDWGANNAEIELISRTNGDKLIGFYDKSKLEKLGTDTVFIVKMKQWLKFVWVSIEKNKELQLENRILSRVELKEIDREITKAIGSDPNVEI